MMLRWQQVNTSVFMMRTCLKMPLFPCQRSDEGSRTSCGIFGRTRLRNANHFLDSLYQPGNRCYSARTTLNVLLKLGVFQEPIYHSNPTLKSTGLENGALTRYRYFLQKSCRVVNWIALPYNSEAFQQEPERPKDTICNGNAGQKKYEVVLSNLSIYLQSKSCVKLEVLTIHVFSWFNLPLSCRIWIFLANARSVHLFLPDVRVPFFDGHTTSPSSCLQLILMIELIWCKLWQHWQVNLDKLLPKQIWLALAAYFTYAQMFIVVSIDSILSIVLDKSTRRKKPSKPKPNDFGRIGGSMKRIN